jgi:hypothetical protein
MMILGGDMDVAFLDACQQQLIDDGLGALDSR